LVDFLFGTNTFRIISRGVFRQVINELTAHALPRSVANSGDAAQTVEFANSLNEEKQFANSAIAFPTAFLSTANDWARISK